MCIMADASFQPLFPSVARFFVPTELKELCQEIYQ